MALNLQYLFDTIDNRDSDRGQGGFKPADSDILDSLLSLKSSHYNIWASADSTAGLPKPDDTNFGLLAYVSDRDDIVISNGSQWVTQTFLSNTAIDQKKLQGQVAGYFTYGSSSQTTNLAKYTFSSDTFVGGFADNSGLGAGPFPQGEQYQNVSRAGKSESKGYLIGGAGAPAPVNPGPTSSRIAAITSFPFASGVISREGSLIWSVEDHAVITDIKNGYVYSNGGQAGETNPITGESYRFPVANPWVIVTQSVMTYGPPPISPPSNTGNNYGHVGNSSETTGYVSGGRTVPGSPTDVNDTQKRSFPYASVTPTAEMVTDGSLFKGSTFGVGISSPTDGYHIGGYDGPGTASPFSAIQKWPFATPGSVTTDAGDLNTETYMSGGMFSETYGFILGGSGGALVNSIQRFPFSTFTTSSSVGNIAPLDPFNLKIAGTQQ